MKKTGLKLDALKINSIKDGEDYKQEIQDYLNSPKQPTMPALNQGQLLTDVLRTFNSSYPHNLLTGDTGIGKTVLSDFILNTLSSEEQFNQSMKLITPEQQKLFGNLKTKLQTMNNESLLYLPNFTDPRVVEGLRYSNIEDIEIDGFAAEDLGIEVSEYMEDFVINNLDLVENSITGKKYKSKFKNSKPFDTFIQGIEEIIKIQNSNLEKNSKIPNWSSQIPEFLKKDKKEIEKDFLRTVIGIELFEEAKPTVEVENKKKEIEKIPMEFELFEEAKPTVEVKNKKKKVKKIPMEFEHFLSLSPELLGDQVSNGISLAEIRQHIDFTIRFNGVDYPPKLLFRTNPQLNPKEQGIAKPVTIGNQGLAKSVALIVSCRQEDGIYPPHVTVARLGPLCKGSIIYVKDGFKEFLETSAYLDNSSKERFLTFLETGDLTLENEGIEYRFHIPKMILGSDNRDPFVRIENSFKEIYEHGLEARITQHEVPSYTKNNKKGRKNTLDIITQRIEELNQETNSNISFDIETLEELLKNTVVMDNLLETKFRDLRKKVVDNIFQYANSNEIETVTIKTLKKIQLEKLPADQFTLLESEINSYDYKKIEDKSNGFVNGLSVTGDCGAILGIKSSLVLRRGDFSGTRFLLNDLNSGNGDASTVKGFILAEQYLTNFLSRIEDKELLDKFNWEITTQFFKMHGPLAGDSASTAIAASMVSELAQIPVYKNRHVTGTLETSGEVGMIGGIYQKATAPYRIAELTNKHQTIIFPAGNVQELEQRLITDPFGLENKISMIPVDTFEQAFTMLTSKTLDSNTIQNSQDLGNSTLNTAITRIEKRLKQEYKPTKSIFSFLTR